MLIFYDQILEFFQLKFNCPHCLIKNLSKEGIVASCNNLPEAKRLCMKRFKAIDIMNGSPFVLFKGHFVQSFLKFIDRPFEGERMQ